ncbi:MAG: hypothetical protein U0736_25415 [Gemmataceae bacterium]
MESTGVYWKPVFNILEGSVHVILVNAEHIKQVPGRKTDVMTASGRAVAAARAAQAALCRPSRSGSATTASGRN